MIILNHEQLTPEWFQARLGIPTASNFDKIIDTKGNPSKQKTKYMYKLAGEFVSGASEETYQNMAMVRGQELEGEARNLYQLIKDELVAESGLCISEGDFKYGASPDGFVGEDGLIEIKCPSMAVHVEYLLNGELPTSYFQQIQGQMLVTERKWVDFMSYYPGIKPLIIRINRDEEFLRALNIELELFCKELEKIIKKIS